MPGPDLLPGGRPVADAAVRSELGEAWGAELPEAPGLDGPAMVAAAAAGELGVLILAGVDLVRDHGPRELAEQALERAFVIAVDHEVNDTTSQADVLLPGVVHAEAEGTFTDWEGRAQATHRAIPVGGAAQDDLGPGRPARGPARGRPRPPRHGPDHRRDPTVPAGAGATATTSPAVGGPPTGRAAAGETGRTAYRRGRTGLVLVTYPLLHGRGLDAGPGVRPEP